MILVTGGSGFLGRHLVSRLAGKGKKVRALYHQRAPGKGLEDLPGISWQCCDLLDIYAVEEAMEDVQEIYHCAAQVSFHPADRKAMLHFNVEGTANLINASVKGIRKFLHVSSTASLGRNRESGRIAESEEWEESRYNSAYSISKYLSELEVWRGMAEGLNAVIINPAILLGEPQERSRRDWDAGPARLIKLVSNGFPFYTEGINAWVDVQDVVTAMILLMESDLANDRFILSAGNYSYKEIFSKMAAAMQKKPPYIPAGKFLSGLMWRWNALYAAITGRRTSITKETAITANKKNFYDNSKLLDAGLNFRYTPVDDTISRMAVRFLEDHTQKKPS